MSCFGDRLWSFCSLLSLGSVNPESFSVYAAKIFDFTTVHFGWFYLLAMVFFVSFCLYLACSKYGRVKLGDDSEDPEYSFFSWISMLFAAGFGAGLVFWGVAEPMTHFAAPPFEGVEPRSAEAAAWRCVIPFLTGEFISGPFLPLSDWFLVIFSTGKKRNL